MAPKGNPAVDTKAFILFIFCMVFLFVCCLVLLLYLGKTMGAIITFLVRYCVLPKKAFFSISGFHISPLSARIFFQNVYYQTENFSLRIVDGYLTFPVWGFWFQDNNWTSLQDSMINEKLIGVRCQVRTNFKNVRGTIVAVDVERRKIFVQLDTSTSGEEDEEGEHGGVSSAHGSNNRQQGGDSSASHHNHADREMLSMPSLPSAVDANRFNDTNSRWRGVKASAQPFQKEDNNAGSTFVFMGNNNNTSEAGASSPATPAPAPRSDVVKQYDAAYVKIRSKPGRCQLHINGMRFCLYNSTGKYEELASDDDAPNAKQRKNSVEKTARRIMNVFRMRMNEAVDLDEDVAARAGVEAAKEQQRAQLANKSFMQKFFELVDYVEAEFFMSTIDIGGAGAKHPYFLHMSFQRGEGRMFLTRDGCPHLDLYRMAAEMTLQEVDMRMAQMDSKLTENQVMRNPSLRDRAQLMFRGSAQELRQKEEPFFSNAVSSDLIRDYGIVMNGKDKGSVHILFYKDIPNVYAGEEIKRGSLPTTGVEIMLESPSICYGPWLEYCRSQMWQFFLPQNFKPLVPLVFEIGKERPNAGMEFFVEFMDDTKVVVPFKRRSPFPSPPFGIEDSNHVGNITATVGSGSQYIQKGMYLLPGEKKQNLEALFMGKNLKVVSNAVLGRPSTLCELDSLQFFLDRQDDIIWNGRKLWNILPTISGGEIYFYMCYVDFFLDLLNDWQFAENMYHNVPLTTELFNTYERAVRDFIPNVKRFEVFVDGGVTLNVNVNEKNVVFSDDPNDRTKNAFAVVKATSGHFNMVLPSDTYQLSFENEVTRPLSAVVNDLSAFVTLPTTHPLYPLLKTDIPFANCELMEINGSMIINVENQAIPQDKTPINEATGRTKRTNYLNLDVAFTNLRGVLMAPHIKGLIDFLENMFLDNTLTIGPDELYWLVAKLQSHATTGSNKRRELKQFIEQAGPVGSDMELCVAVRLLDVEATLSATQTAKASPGLCLRTSLFTFTFVKQFAVADMAITVAPITARPVECSSSSDKKDSFICVGAITVGLLKHFGRMPLKPKIHEALDISVKGVSFDISIEQLCRLVEVGKVIEEHFKAEDTMMVTEVNEARANAELAAEQILKGASRRQRQSQSGGTKTGGISMSGDVVVLMDPKDTSNAAEEGTQLVEQKVSDDPLLGGGGEHQKHQKVTAPHEVDVAAPTPRKRKKHVFFRSAEPASPADEDNKGDEVCAYVPFSSTVSEELAKGFAEFMDSVNQAEDEAKDYGVFFDHVSVTHINGAVRIQTDGALSIDLPQGVSLARSSVNDGNSSKRMSVAARDVSIKALMQTQHVLRTFGPKHNSDSENVGDFIEVFHVCTSICMRQYIAYPFDGSLEGHQAKQRKFVEDNDYEHLVGLSWSPPQGAPNMPNRPPSSDHGGSPSVDMESPYSPHNLGGGATSFEPPTLVRPTKPPLATPIRQDDMARHTLPMPTFDLASQNSSPIQVPLGGVLSGAFVDAQSEGTSSADTTAHRGCTDESHTMQLSNRSLTGTLKEDGSMRFLTCLSASEDSDFEGTGSDGDERHRGIPNNAFADDRSSVASDPGTSVASPMTSHEAQNDMPPIPLLRFYRSYVKAPFARDNGPTVLDYRLPKKPSRSRPVRNRAHFFAQLPSAEFLPFEYDTLFPAFLSWESTLFEFQDEEASLYAWAGRTTDNRERSQQGSTTKHFHVEAIDPITVLVTKHAVQLAASAVETCLDAFGGQHSSRDSSPSGSKSRYPVRVGALSAVPQRSSTALFPTQQAAKSRQREQQKRWLSEDHIVSAVFPCAEIKLLTELPVPDENLLNKHIPTLGMYSSTLVIRGLHCVAARNQPPAGVEVAAESTHKLSASIRASTIGLLTFIEYEALPRVGNLNMDIPGLPFNPDKDAIALGYISDISGRGKQDVVRGTQGGACNVSLNTVDIRLTRDFVDYVNSLRFLVDNLQEDVKAKLTRRARFSPKTPHSTHAQTPSSFGSPASAASATGQQNKNIFNIFSAARTIQGKGNVTSVKISFFDTWRESGRITVDNKNVTFLEVGKPSANFFCTGPGSRSRDRVVHVQAVGEVDFVSVKVFPALLHILHDRPEPLPFSPVKRPTTKPSKVSFSEETSPLLPATSASGTITDTPSVVYNATFTLRTLDMSVLHSELNFIQLKGKSLTGCAESRAERVSSRECIQVDALTEGISERLRACLRRKLFEARERTKRSRYAAPPTTTEQLQLNSTASFFIQQLLVHYIADSVIGNESNDVKKRKRESQVIVAVVHEFAIAAHSTCQFNSPNDQWNFNINVGKILMRSPYRPQAADTIHPQVYQFISQWKRAVKNMSSYGGAVDGGNSSTSQVKPVNPNKEEKNTAFVVTVQAHAIEALISLPQDVTQKFLLPQISAFIQASDDRMNAKVHIHPFTITSENNTAAPLDTSAKHDSYKIVLPNVYIMLGQDKIKTCCTVMMETIGITVTPLFVNHALMTYEKMTSEIFSIFSKSVPDDIVPVDGRRSNKAPTKNPLPISVLRGSAAGIAKPPKRRLSFLFVLQGVRVSYLTVMTDLRLSVRRITATADTPGEEKGGGKNLKWVVHVTNAQIALVDRDDHDQMNAARESMMRPPTDGQAKPPPVVKSLAATVGSSSSLAALRRRDKAAAALPPPAPSSKHASSAPQTRANFALGGFIWGSAELSFTISNGKKDRSTVRETFNENASFNAYSLELQTALLESLSHTSSRWNLLVYSPLVVLRFGLPDLLQQMLQETRSDIGTMKSAAEKENNFFKARLSQNKTFRKLKEEKKRFEAIIKRTENERMSRLRAMTEQVANDAQWKRRRGFSATESEAQALADFFSITSEHTVIAKITDFLVVVPFGDAAFRNLVEEVPRAFSCGKVERHIHSHTCINRRSFIPMLALKMIVNDIRLDCSLQNVKRFVPIIHDRALGGLRNTNGKRVEDDYTESTKSHGRFFMNNTYLYFTDGSPLDDKVSLRQLLNETRILGGRGQLGTYTSEEIRLSRNTLYIASIESPFHVHTKDENTRVGVVLDLSGPQVQISSKAVSIINQLVLETSPEQLTQHMRLSDKSSSSSMHVDPAVFGDKKSPDPSSSCRSDLPEESHLELDLSARLAAGDVEFYAYSFTKQEASEPTTIADRKFLRRYQSGRSQSQHTFARFIDPVEEKLPSVSQADDVMNSILRIPLPGIVVQTVMNRGGTVMDENNCVVRVEVRTGAIELTPSISILVQEIEASATMYDESHDERRTTILNRVQELDSEVPSLPFPLHCTVSDILVPIPRALTTALSSERIKNVVVIRSRHPKGQLSAAALSETSRVTKARQVSKAFTSVHVTITNFRLVLSTSPVTSTAFTVFLDDRSSIDIVINVFQRPFPSTRYINKFPDLSVMLSIRRLRAECQTKLEVKCLELFLPEAEMNFSRRHGTIGEITSINMNFPFNVDGATSNVIMRLPHLSQLFTVVKLWTKTAKDTMDSIERLTTAETALTSPRFASSEVLSGAPQQRKDERFLVAVTLTQGVCRLDLGSGNTHQLVIGAVRLATEFARRVDDSSTLLVLANVSHLLIRSEGVLSGVMHVGECISQLFFIKNSDDCDTFLRSPEGRTFRVSLQVKEVNVTFKERQLKDIFECKVKALAVNSMDGIGDENYNTTELDVSLTNATLGATPSTVPAFLTFFGNCSDIVGDQQRIALEKLKSTAMFRQPTEPLSEYVRDIVNAWDKDAAAVRTSTDDIAETGDGIDSSLHPFSSSQQQAGDTVGGLIPYMGNPLQRVPCGQLRFSVEDTTLLLGATSSGEAATGCVVATFPKARLSFAECPCDDYTAAKRVLVIETHHVELYRPGAQRVVILGFKGTNTFEFYTRQVLGEKEVGFTLTLRQTHPWTGNPRFRDFEEMIMLIKSFIDKKNADVFQKFGRVDQFMVGSPTESGGHTMQPLAPASVMHRQTSSAETTTLSAHDGRGQQLLDASADLQSDVRQLKPLRGTKFSPQLRFGGDVSVNTEVILNWVGVTEKMLPNVLNAKLCDELEMVLVHLANTASERVEISRK